MSGRQLILSAIAGKELQRLLKLVVVPLGEMEPAVFGRLSGCWMVAATDDGEVYTRRLSAAVAGHIVRFWVRDTATRIINQRYRTLNQTEKCFVIQHTAMRMRHRLQAVATMISDYLQSEPVLIIEGFADFRVPGLRDDIQDAVDEGADAVLLDREYRDFLQVISRVVRNQPKRSGKIHVVLSRTGLFRLVGEDGKPLELSGLPQLGTGNWISTGSKNRDDILISSLVALSPRSVLLHDCSPIRCLALAPHTTARRERLQIVFGDNVAICPGCDLCNSRE